MSTRAEAIARLASDPLIEEMTQDLIDAEVEPSSPEDADWSDFVFAAAMEYSFRGGDADALVDHFDAAAEAVVEVYDRLNG